MVGVLLKKEKEYFPLDGYYITEYIIIIIIFLIIDGIDGFVKLISAVASLKISVSYERKSLSSRRNTSSVRQITTSKRRVCPTRIITTGCFHIPRYFLQKNGCFSVFSAENQSISLRPSPTPALT